MKFNKFDISLFRLQTDTNNLNNEFTIKYNNEEGKLQEKRLKVSSNAIGVTYKLKKRQSQPYWWRSYVNLWRYEQGEFDIRNPFNYYTEIYDLVDNNLDEKKVYLYYKMNERHIDVPNRTFEIYDHKGRYAIESKDKFFLFNNILYYLKADNQDFSSEQLGIYLKEYIYRQNKKFDSLKKEIELFERISEADETKKQREPIPEDVKFEVWRRDNGKCVMCSTNEKLEFDHIIPFSKGGSNTARNIQLLCESCNRKKGARI